MRSRRLGRPAEKKKRFPTGPGAGGRAGRPGSVAVVAGQGSATGGTSGGGSFRGVTSGSRGPPHGAGTAAEAAGGTGDLPLTCPGRAGRAGRGGPGAGRRGRDLQCLGPRNTRVGHLPGRLPRWRIRGRRRRAAPRAASLQDSGDTAVCRSGRHRLLGPRMGAQGGGGLSFPLPGSAVTVRNLGRPRSRPFSRPNRRNRSSEK